jgi:PhzF family phenazine biosynthesis protein
MGFTFYQVDVFTSKGFRGNPLAVVVGADSLTDEDMARLANWTNLSETTFLLRPTSPHADYRVRIFTPHGELPFAGHPTLGSCFVWLANGGKPKGEQIIQECEIGLVTIRSDNKRLYFAAPPLRRSGPIDDGLMAHISEALGLRSEQIVKANWTDNGPAWVSVLLKQRSDVLNVKPNFVALAGAKVGIVAPYGDSSDENAPDYEVRAFTSAGVEDPVTGSLNAGIAQFLIGEGIAKPNYIAAQGTVLGREGRVYVESAGGEIWIGGDVVSCITGTLEM